jgi:glutathione S-transferase
MLLIGMYDSPFVRRCAISARRLGIAYEHANWSVGADHERIRALSPLGRVPALVLDDGEVLTDSAAILDYLDELAGPGRALVPPSGAARREVLRIVSNAVGAAEKARELVNERIVRPPEKRHEPWLERCRAQMHGALGEVEKACSRRPGGAWLTGEAMTQADITCACIYTFLTESIRIEDQGVRYPQLKALTLRCEGLPEFQATHLTWFAFTPD